MRNINAHNAWMENKKKNRPKQVWNVETKQWEKVSL